MPRRPILIAVPLAAILSTAVLGLAGPIGAPALPTPGTPTAPSSPTASPLTGPSSGPVAVASPGPPRASPPPTSPRAVPGVRPIPESELQARLEGIRRRAGIPGVSVTILWPDGRSWTGVAGLADVARRRPVEPDTAFAIASVSKTYTAALVLDLVEEGRVALDAPVRRYLPTARKVPPGVTVRQLLDHTSGLFDYFLNPLIDRALLSDRARSWTTADVFRYVKKPYATAGAGFHYSNTNYLVLGMLAEAVTGRPVATEIRERFLEPLGLDATFYQAHEEPSVALARGYRFNGSARTAKPIDLSDATDVRPFRSVVTAAGAAGSIAATSGDVARWGQALYGGRVLEPESLAEMLGGADGTVPLGPRVPYGLGVQEFVVGRWPTYGHSGRFLGFRAAMRYLPESGVTIAVLTNQSRTDPSGIVHALLDIVFPVPQPCAGCR